MSRSENWRGQSCFVHPYPQNKPMTLNDGDLLAERLMGRSSLISA
jgi:hypothetical protein